MPPLVTDHVCLHHLP